MGDRKTRQRLREYRCTICEKTVPFSWACVACTFQICQTCMKDNEWGMSCNKVTWECPDCGRINVL